MVEMMVASEPPVHSCNGERRRLEMLRWDLVDLVVGILVHKTVKEEVRELRTVKRLRWVP
jgi:hypothetical protein